MAKLRDHIERVLRGEEPIAPVARLIGFRTISANENGALFELETDERHWNPMGTVHGGILCDLADAAMGMAWAMGLDEGESFTTLELKASYLRPVFRGRITAEARVVHRGRTVGLVECDVRDAAGKLVARVASTCLTLRGDAAKGR
jgi:uncharacterized protein (TIGR00369 family)